MSDALKHAAKRLHRAHEGVQDALDGLPSGSPAEVVASLSDARESIAKAQRVIDEASALAEART